MKNRIKVLRAERDWTQADLAVQLEVSRQTVIAIENRSIRPEPAPSLSASPMSSSSRSKRYSLRTAGK